MHRTVLRLPSRLSGVVPSDPDFQLPPAPNPSKAETIPDLALPPVPPPPPSLEERLGDLLARVAEAAAALRTVRRDEVALATRAIADLVCRATRHLVRRKIESGEYDLEGMIGQALRKLDPQSAAVVTLHPADLQGLRQTLAAFDGRGTGDLSWEADASLTRGSFRIRTNDASLWSDLETRIEDVRAALEQSLESSAFDAGGVADEEAA